MSNHLLGNLDRIHTTDLGVVRIRNNLGLACEDVVDWCKQAIKAADDITRTGKNWYVSFGDCILTVNTRSFTVITAHRKRLA